MSVLVFILAQVSPLWAETVNKSSGPFSVERIEELKSAYHPFTLGRQQPLRSDAEFHYANAQWGALFKYWNPRGLSRERFKEIVGEPEFEDSEELQYSVRGAYVGYALIFKIENERIQADAPLLDLMKEPLSKEVVFRLTEQYRNTVGVRDYFEKSKGPNYYYSNAALNSLLYLWKPFGLDTDRFKEVIGEPQFEDSNKLVYRFDTGPTVYHLEYRIKEGSIESLDKRVAYEKSEYTQRPISKAKFDLLKELYREIVIARTRPNEVERFQSANQEWILLSEFWSPAGLTVNQLKDLLGHPDSETPNELAYGISSPYISYSDKFEVDRGVVKTWRMTLDIESYPISEPVTRVLRGKYRSIVGGRLRDKWENRLRYFSKNRSLNNLLRLWNPNGVHIETFKAIVGEPDGENSAGDIGYELNTGEAVYSHVFSLNRERISSKRLEVNTIEK